MHPYNILLILAVDLESLMRVKFLYKTILVLTAFFCFSLGAYAQYSSKEELKEAADKMFEEKNYTGSLKLFSQLLSTYPKDPNYNYKYGACVLFGSQDKEEAIRYLKFAASKPGVDPIAFYFLGKGYHHEYEFAKALDNYNKFKEKASSKEQKQYNVDREIEMCQNGEKLLKSMADIGVLSKKDIKESDFFRSYKLDGIGGKIIVKPEQFKTKLDKKNKERSIVYLGQAKDMIIFSSYGKDGASGRDIYKAVKKSNGDWGEAVPFSKNINSEYDEDYPFLHPDGKTLYFSSKGYTSMGGYDVFKSTFNEVTKEWSSPQNLDFPINTPDDDILYISDMENKLAYFASSRASKQGELTVYNVTVESVPFVHSVIYGFFIAEANPDMKNATITVRAVDKDRKYGVHKTKSESGEYLLMFPTNGGKFKILVETTEDAPVHSAIIDIPPLDGFRALKQELRLVGEGDEEKLVVKNLFDESDEFSIDNPLVVQNILKEKAKMEVNTTKAKVDSLAAIQEEDEIVAGNNLQNSLGSALSNASNKSVYKEFSDDELTEKTNETASKIINQTEISKAKSISAYKIAEDNSAEAKLLVAESDQLLLDAESSGSESEKNEKLELSERKKMKAAKLVNEAVASLAIAKTLDNEVAERSSDLEKVKALQASINTKLENKERVLAEAELTKLDEIAEATYHNESALETEKKITNDKFLAEEKKFSNLNENVVDLQDREVELTTSIKTLEEKKSLTKKKKEVEALESQIKMLKIDVEDTQYDLELARKKVEKAKQPYIKAKNEEAITKSVIAMLNDEETEDEVTEPQKISLENDLAYFEKKGLVGLFPEEDEAPILASGSSSYNINEHKDEYEIVDEEGEIIDYNTNYSAQLTNNIENVTDPEAKKKATVEIYESWINDIDDEIKIRKAQLAVEENATEKERFENKITTLEALKAEKNSEILAYNSSIAETSEEKESTLTTEEEEPVAVVEALTEELVVEEEPTTYKTKYEEDLAKFSGEDTYESSTLKTAIHENWVKDIEAEIAEKQADLEITSGSEKKAVENEIAILENNLLEQEEFASLYALQAESLQGSSEELAVEEEALTEESVVGEQPTTYKTKYEEDLAKFSGEDTYESSTLKAAIHENWAKDIEAEIAEKQADLEITNGSEKKAVENEIAILENNLLEQEEFASLYALQAESLQGSSEDLAVEEEKEAVLEPTTTEEEEPVAVTEETMVEESVVEEQPVAYKTKYEEDLAKFSGEDTYESSTLKAAIHENWAKDIEAEIAEKQADLEITNGSEKKAVENEIAILENNLLEQEEFASLYALQAESLQGSSEELAVEEEKEAVLEPTETIEEEVAVITEEPTSEENITEEVVEEQPVAYKTKYEEDLGKFSGEDTYESSTLKAAIHENWAKDIEAEIAEKQADLEITNGSEKKAVENEIAILENNLLEQEEFASLYVLQAESLQGSSEELAVEEEKEAVLEPTTTEKEEPVAVTEEAATEEVVTEETIGESVVEETAVNNTIKENTLATELAEENLTANNLNGAEDDYSNLKYNNGFNYKSPQSKTALASVTALKKEARDIKDEADVKMNEAGKASNEEEKQRLIKDAEVLYEKSERKQESIAKVYEGANRSEYFKNQKEVTELKKGNTTNPINKTIAELMEDEASNYYEEAKLKRTEAINAPSFSQKESLLQDAYELEMKAIEAQKRAKLKLGGEDALPVVADVNTNNISEEEIVEEAVVEEEVIEPVTEEEVKTTPASELEITEELTANDKELIEELDGATINLVKEAADYKEYAELTKKKRRLVKEAQVEYVKAEQVEADIKSQQQLIASLNAVDESSENDAQKTTREYQIKEIEKAITENEAQALAYRKSAKEKENEANGISNKATAILSKNGNTKAKEYAAIERAETFDGELLAKVTRKSVNSTSLNENRGNTSQPSLANIDNIPTVLKESIFVINKNKAVYSESKKIPVSPKLPEGLVFKVQVGAFRNPIPQSHFKGFAPIMAEDAGRGITRYTAGLFKTFNKANDAKGSIRSIGYSDAFVVAFFNGKRINMIKAREMANGGTTEEDALANNSRGSNNSNTTNTSEDSSNSNNGNSSNNTNTVAENTGNTSPVTKPVTKEVNDGISKDVRNITGTFFTIQVGVYSKPVTGGQFKNVGSLNSERTASGLIRYTSGVFKTLVEANFAKESIRSAGVSDAFVVAYSNGVKTTVASAKEQLGLNNPEPIKKVEKPVVVEEPINEDAVVEEELENNTVIEEEEAVIEEEASTVESTNIETAKALKIKFKVQLGAYEDDVPVDEAGLYLKLTSRGIKNYEQDGKTIYIIGSFRDYAAATDLQIEMKEMGVKNPKVVAFQKTKEIEVSEALKLIENN